MKGLEIYIEVAQLMKCLIHAPQPLRYKLEEPSGGATTYHPSFRKFLLVYHHLRIALGWRRATPPERMMFLQSGYVVVHFDL